MAKKPPTAYVNAALAPAPISATPEPLPAAVSEANHETRAARRGRPPAGRTLKEASSPVMLYLHPAGLKALKRYALDQNTKVHSLLLDAVEAWARSKGLSDPIRVPAVR